MKLVSQVMKYYTTKLEKTASLNPTQKQIYFLLVSNLNQSQKKFKPITRCLIKKNIDRALTTIADALQILRYKGLVYYDKIDRCWRVIISKCQGFDNYDNHVKFKWDWPNFISLEAFLSKKRVV